MNQTVLITGASSGLGLEFARLFAQDHFDVILTARNEDKLTSLARQLEEQFKVKTKIISLDLSLQDSAQRLFAEAGPVDVLVNNAGFGDFGSFDQCDWTKQAQMINLNVLSLTQLSRLYLPGFVKSGNAKILNLASVAAFEPGPLMSVYYATKAYVLSFSQAIARELKGTGVTVTALCPGPTATEFEKNAALENSNLFKSLTVAKASDVAKFGYKALKKGKKVAVPGLANKLAVFGGRFMPRSLLTGMVYKIQSSRSKA